MLLKIVYWAKFEGKLFFDAKCPGPLLQRSPLNIQKHNYKSYVNSKIILADVKLTNSEKQIRDGGHRGEERCIVLIDTDEIAII